MKHLRARRSAGRLTRSLPSATIVAVTVAAACGELPTDPRARALAPDGLRPDGARTSASTLALPVVTRVTVSPVSGGMDTVTWTLPVGATQQFRARGYDALGGEVAGTPKYASTNTRVLTVDPATGLAKAIAPGSATVTATMGVATGSSRPITVVTMPSPTGGPAIALSIVRFDGGSGAATVSSAIPLPPAALQPGGESRVRLVVGNVEQRVYARGLSSRHPDGSLRAVLVQFQLPSLGASQTLAGSLLLDSPRPAAMSQDAAFVRPGAPVAGAPAGLPQAAALPSDVSYLLTTDLVGATTSSAATTALGGDFARYESDFRQYAESHWASTGDDWAAGNYYDRALIYYAMWTRTANPTYWARAGRMAYRYRADYLQPNQYGSSPHWAQLEGVEKHYLLTGDDSSRVAVLNTAMMLNALINSSYMTRQSGESRIAARVLHSQLLAWRLSPSGAAPVAFRGQNTADYDWGAAVEAALQKIGAWQQADGSYPADGQVCGGQLNYMVGLLNDALIKTHDYYVPQTSSRAVLQGNVRTLVRRAVDYLWTTQWRAGDRSFHYASVDCTASGVGGRTASPDLNNMISSGFGWVARHTGDASYRTRGDQIFSGGVTQAYLGGSKQFNESYTNSFRYLGFR